MIGNILLKIKQNKAGWAKQFLLYLKTAYLLRKVKNNRTIFEKECVVSFTTYGHRLKSADYVIRSILDGTVLPEGIFLYVSNKDYSNILSNRPFLKTLMNTGYLHLEIVKDVRSYTKFVYALEQHKEKNIVICDDDVLYPKYWLSELVKSKNTVNSSNVISCHRGHYVAYENGEILSYNTWRHDISEPISIENLIFPTGTGGVLYPPNSISFLATNRNLFEELAPTADDVWFWFCSLYNDSKFVLTDRKVYDCSDFVFFPYSQEISLYHENVHNNANDIQIQNVFKYFKSLNPDFEKKFINK